MHSASISTANHKAQYIVQYIVLFNINIIYCKTRKILYFYLLFGDLQYIDNI